MPRLFRLDASEMLSRVLRDYHIVVLNDLSLIRGHRNLSQTVRQSFGKMPSVLLIEFNTVTFCATPTKT